MISLAKNQGISLKKTAPTLKRAHMGLGWKGRKGVGGFFKKLLDGNSSIDLDASALGYDASGRRIEEVWFRRLRGTGIVHSGDDRVGAGDGDNEIITVDLEAVNPAIKTLIFTVNSFTGETFNEIANAFVRLVDADTQKEIARFELSDSGNHTGLIMCKLVRNGSDWELVAIGERTNGRTFHDMTQLANHI